MSGEREAYKAELKEALDQADPLALTICREWHDHFGEPGWGSVDFVRGELAKATRAVWVFRTLGDSGGP